jgi:hypothetical protein
VTTTPLTVLPSVVRLPHPGHDTFEARLGASLTGLFTQLIQRLLKVVHGIPFPGYGGAFGGLRDRLRGDAQRAAAVGRAPEALSRLRVRSHSSMNKSCFRYLHLVAQDGYRLGVAEDDTIPLDHRA